jgi:biotin carboxyl carrier protein
MALEKIEAPLPGKVISVKVKLGDKIAEFGEICTIEAMKMENPILATVSGVVKEILVSEGQVLKAGDLLAVIEY